MQNAVFAGFTPDNVVDLLLLSFAGAAEPTPAVVEAKVGEFLVGPFSVLQPQKSLIIDEVLRRIRVSIGAASTLDEKDTDHIAWLPQADRAAWRFWPRMLDYLRRVDRLPPSVLQELDRSTDQTLERLESPARAGRWDRRGLVVGHVQSGKTTHYTSLTAKALDAGYQIVIILAGIHNSLRSQTHERIDKHLIGRDSAALIEAIRAGTADGSVGLIGVGEDERRLGKPPLPFTILTCTTSAEDGDFRTQIANQIGFTVSHGSRLVMVVKKNATILRNLTRWLRTQNMIGSQAEARIGAPTLVIDDEADHASVNTSRDPDDDPSTINKLIRQLLMSFDRVGFVGYTATPFANIFISANNNSTEFGADLFPKSFIVNLKAPSDYIGPSMVFGHAGDESAGIPEETALPMFLPVLDAQPWLPDKHDKNQVPGPMPASLKEAVRMFVLVCATRAARGDVDVHNSMLVHATRFVNVQGRVAEQLENELIAIRNLVNSGSTEKVAAIQAEFAELWSNQISKPQVKFKTRLGDRCAALPAWDDVWKSLAAATLRIKILRVNGTSTDALAYSRAPKGIYVIAVGGDKLSRGLTLEGLSVSYFLRTSNMFDTLMQMGRWFGYRPRYADLCRVYTTTYLHETFQEIALAMDDLRGDLDRMSDAGKTPEDFGLRIRTPSDGLLITAANKIRRGEEVYVRFANSLVQTLEIARLGQKAQEIRDATRTFMKSLVSLVGPPRREVRGRPTAHSVWSEVPAKQVLEFLFGYEAYSTPSFTGRCDALRRYIGEQVTKSELTDWTVVLMAGSKESTDIGGIKLQLVKRSFRVIGRPDRFATQVLVGLADEAMDLNKQEFEKAISKSAKESKTPELPGRDAVRQVRPSTRGLLLIYPLADEADGEKAEFIPAIAISFPDSDSAKPLAYTVNEVWRQEYGLVEEVSDAETP